MFFPPEAVAASTPGNDGGVRVSSPSSKSLFAFNSPHSPTPAGAVQKASLSGPSVDILATPDRKITADGFTTPVNQGISTTLRSGSSSEQNSPADDEDGYFTANCYTPSPFHVSKKARTDTPPTVPKAMPTEPSVDSDLKVLIDKCFNEGTENALDKEDATVSEAAKTLTAGIFGDVEDSGAVPAKTSTKTAGDAADHEAPTITTTVKIGSNTLTCLIDPKQHISTIEKESAPLVDIFQTWSVMSLAFAELGKDFPSFQHKFFHRDSNGDHSLVIGADFLGANDIELWSQGDGEVLVTNEDNAGFLQETM